MLGSQRNESERLHHGVCLRSRHACPNRHRRSRREHATDDSHSYRSGYQACMSAPLQPPHAPVPIGHAVRTRLPTGRPLDDRAAAAHSSGGRAPKLRVEACRPNHLGQQQRGVRCGPDGEPGVEAWQVRGSRGDEGVAEVPPQAAEERRGGDVAVGGVGGQAAEGAGEEVEGEVEEGSGADERRDVRNARGKLAPCTSSAALGESKILQRRRRRCRGVWPR